MVVGLVLAISACGADEESSGSPEVTAGSTVPGSDALRSSDTTTPPSTSPPSTSPATTPPSTSPSSPATTEPVATAAAPTTDDPGTTQADTTEPATTEPAPTSDPSTTTPATSEPPASTDGATTSGAATTTSTTPAATTTTSAAAPTTGATTTLAAPTTTVAPVPGQPNPACLVTVAAGDSLDSIAAAARTRLNDANITFSALQVENAIPNPDFIDVGQVLDVCVGNQIDDETGGPLPEFVPPPAPALPEVPQGGTNFGSGVQAQQNKLNELLTPYGFPSLAVDGQSGRLTRQALCAARVGLGLDASRDEMVPGSAEEAQLQAAGGLLIPRRADTGYNHWALIDLHCQVMFTGNGGDGFQFIFPVSSGESGYETRPQSASRTFRFDPALSNGGWHDSSDYPVTVDNPLNGNMYKPIYFDGGQAIHGANNVPTSPASKGCVRVSVGHQNMIVDWLGIGGVERELWDARDRIGLTVTIQNTY